MKKQSCSKCGSKAPVVRSDYHFKEMGLPIELMQIEVVKCPECGNADPIIGNLNDLMHSVALIVICSRCKLSGEEVRFLRKYAGKSLGDFARLVHVDHTHLSKVENGRVEIGSQLDKLVRFVVLNLSPELSNKAGELLELLPEISDDCPDERPELQINPATMRHCFA
jgi:transcriptional regulator with XRE-family HTH domain